MLDINGMVFECSGGTANVWQANLAMAAKSWEAFCQWRGVVTLLWLGYFPLQDDSLWRSSHRHVLRLAPNYELKLDMKQISLPFTRVVLLKVWKKALVVCPRSWPPPRNTVLGCFFLFCILVFFSGEILAVFFLISLWGKCLFSFVIYTLARKNLGNLQTQCSKLSLRYFSHPRSCHGGMWRRIRLVFWLVVKVARFFSPLSLSLLTCNVNATRRTMQTCLVCSVSKDIPR